MASYSIKTLKDGIAQLPGSDYLYLAVSDFYERTGAKLAAREILEEQVPWQQSRQAVQHIAALSKQLSLVKIVKKSIIEPGIAGMVVAKSYHGIKCKDNQRQYRDKHDIKQFSPSGADVIDPFNTLRNHLKTFLLLQIKRPDYNH